jgi:hypothetical protein
MFFTLAFLSAPRAQADLGNPTPAEKPAFEFERSLFDSSLPPGELKPLPEAGQRPLFEAFVKTLKTPEEKVAFLSLAAYRYVFSINPNVYVDFAAPMLKDEDAGVRLAAVKGIRFFRSDFPGVNVDGMRIDAYVDSVAPMMTSEKDPSIRGAAMTCVGALHGVKYLDALVSALDKEPADAARAGAAAGLVCMAAGENVPREARNLALSAILRHLRPDENEAVLQGLLYLPRTADLDTRAYADGVAALLPNVNLRANAIRSLRYIGATAHAGEVAELLSDPLVALDVAEALEVIATREQIPALLKMIEGGDYARLLALEALDRLDARDQRPAVERVAAMDAANGKKSAFAATLLRKWDEKDKAN